jgi:hypothetical protein
LPMAAPRMNAMASAITLYFCRKALNSLYILPPLGARLDWR